MNEATEAAEKLIEAIADAGLDLALPSGIPTHEHSVTKCWSRLNQVFLSEHSNDLLTSCNTQPEVRGINTDHLPILTELSLDMAVTDLSTLPMLRSDPTPTFSHSAPSIYTPTYETPDTWDCITVVSDFPDVVPAHPLDNLPRVAPEPVTIRSLMRRWPYTTHRFTEFHPRQTDGDYTELFLAPRGHLTHAHTLEHSTFCREHICPTHFPYGGNRLAK